MLLCFTAVSEGSDSVRMRSLVHERTHHRHAGSICQERVELFIQRMSTQCLQLTVIDAILGLGLVVWYGVVLLVCVVQARRS